MSVLHGISLQSVPSVQSVIQSYLHPHTRRLQEFQVVLGSEASYDMVDVVWCTLLLSSRLWGGGYFGDDLVFLASDANR